jgi:hypothetical protein
MVRGVRRVRALYFVDRVKIEVKTSVAGALLKISGLLEAIRLSGKTLNVDQPYKYCNNFHHKLFTFQNPSSELLAQGTSNIDGGPGNVRRSSFSFLSAVIQGSSSSNRMY